MPTPLMLNAFSPEHAERLDSRTQEMIARRQRVLGPSYKLFYEHPVHFVRGEGVWLYDPDGVPYLDVYNNVPSVAILIHTSQRLLQDRLRRSIHTRATYMILCSLMPSDC